MREDVGVDDSRWRRGELDVSDGQKRRNAAEAVDDILVTQHDGDVNGGPSHLTEKLNYNIRHDSNRIAE